MDNVLYRVRWGIEKDRFEIREYEIVKEANDNLWYFNGVDVAKVYRGIIQDSADFKTIFNGMRLRDYVNECFYVWFTNGEKAREYLECIKKFGKIWQHEKKAATLENDIKRKTEQISKCKEYLEKERKILNELYAKVE